MQTIHIKTWTTSTKKSLHQFFILSKGHHAGRPMDEPCPNCFVVFCASEQERTVLYWLCYALWQSGKFHEYRVGSVIEFLHIHDIRKLMHDTRLQIEVNPEKYTRFVDMLQRLLKYETCLNDQLHKLKKLKCSLAAAMLKEGGE